MNVEGEGARRRYMVEREGNQWGYGSKGSVERWEV